MQTGRIAVADEDVLAYDLTPWQEAVLIHCATTGQAASAAVPYRSGSRQHRAWVRAIDAALDAREAQRKARIRRMHTAYGKRRR